MQHQHALTQQTLFVSATLDTTAWYLEELACHVLRSVQIMRLLLNLVTPQQILSVPSLATAGKVRLEQCISVLRRKLAFLAAVQSSRKVWLFQTLQVPIQEVWVPLIQAPSLQVLLLGSVVTLMIKVNLKTLWGIAKMHSPSEFRSWRVRQPFLFVCLCHSSSQFRDRCVEYVGVLSMGSTRYYISVVVAAWLKSNF